MLRPATAREPEYMDQPADPLELDESLDHLVTINRWLGGRWALLSSLALLVRPGETFTALDVGSGAGDLPLAVIDWAARRGGAARITIVDLHPETVRIAHRRTRDRPDVQAVRGDVLRLPFPDDAFDFALLSLTLHHLPDEHRPQALAELARVARRAVLVNELERNWPNYLGARLLGATVWRNNRLTRHDGPLSVRRAFTPDELLRCAHDAGLARARVRRFFFHRLVMVAAC